MFWKLVAKIVTIPVVRRWLIVRAQRTPYFHLDGYMGRWWVFNPYGSDQAQNELDRHTAKYNWLPSVRIHHILREDLDRALHDHPWNARTIILDGWYKEDRLMPDGSTQTFYRFEGGTAGLKHGEYHTITEVSKGGVWTLFFTWEWKGDWGFLVDGVKVPWKEYCSE